MARSVDCTFLLPEAADAVHEGCPVLTKRRHLSLSQGQCGTAAWSLRWPDGQVADVSDCFPGAASVSGSSSASSSESAADNGLSLKVRFKGCDRGCILAEVDGTVLDAATGSISFPIPEEVCQDAGIYQFQAGIIRDSDGALAFSDSGLISVEHGMWGNQNSQNGPPTIQEIRFHLRDRAAENDLLRAVEFDDAEILEAVRWPIAKFNEVPPPLSPFSCKNFPYRYHWRNAIVGELMKIAAHHYVRNKTKMASGGLSVDDKAKEVEYLAIADRYEREWLEFIHLKKRELNMKLGFGDLGSSYSRW